jgi:hypothetical protein
MNETSVESESALKYVLADSDVDGSSPLGSTDRELIHLVEDSEAGVPWTAEVVVCLCRIMESIETMEDVLETLETTGETVWSESLPPQETT